MQAYGLLEVKMILKNITTKIKIKRLKEPDESAWSHCYWQTFLRQQ